MYNARNIRMCSEVGDCRCYFYIPWQSGVVGVLLMLGAGDAINTGGYHCTGREIRSALNVG